MSSQPLILDFERPRTYLGSMKKAIFLLLVLVLVSTASAEIWFKGTLDQAVAKAKTEHKLVLVDFYSYT
jgi:hypothetical protein